MKTFLLVILFSTQIFAARWAIVKSQKAIIYADKTMSSPIGYYNKGTKIRVGDFLHNKGLLYATTYQSKVVFIRANDVRTSKEARLAQSASDRIGAEALPKEIDSKLGVELGISSLNFSQSIKDLNESKSSSSFIFSPVLYKKHRGQHVEIKYGLGYYSFTENESSFSLLDLYIGYVNYFYARPSFRLAGLLTLNAVPYALRNFEGEFDTSGYGVGSGAGLELHSNRFMAVSFVLGFKYNFYYLTGFDNPVEATSLGQDVDTSSLIHGYKLYTSFVAHY